MRLSIQNRDMGNERTIVRAVEPPARVVPHHFRGQAAVVPLVLSLALVASALVFTVGTYPLWPRLYLSPVLDLFPGLADTFLGWFSTPLAHQAVDATGGDLFFYLYALTILLIFATYAAALRWVIGKRPTKLLLRWALISTAVAGLLLVSAPTLFTSDIFSYVMYGRLAAVHQANPFVVTPSHFPDDPVYHLVFWKDTVSVYGPVWIDISYLVMRAVQGSVALEIGAFKVLALAFHLANSLLVWHILNRLRPRDRLVGTVAFAWNPLLLIEFPVNGHNDGAMLFFMLLATLCLVRGQQKRAVVLLTAAILTKWIAIFLVPLFVLACMRSSLSLKARVIRLGSLLAVCLLTAVGLYAPYWAGLPTLTAMFDSAAVERVINTFAELLTKPVSDIAREAGAFDPNKVSEYALKALFGLAFVLAWMRELWRSRNGDDGNDLVLSSLRTIFAYLAIACTWFWPWYVAWLMPFASIDLRSKWAKATLLFTFTASFFYSLWPGAPLRPFEPYYDARAIVLFGPPLMYLVGSAMLERWRVAQYAREASLEE